MKKLLFVKLLGLILLSTAGIAQANFLFMANLTSDQETPVVPPPGQGSGATAFFVLDDLKTRLTYDIRLFGLDLRGISPAGVSTPANQPFPGEAVGSPARNDNVIRLHIHSQFFGVAGPIVFGIIDLPTAPQLLNDPNDLAIDLANLHITGAWDLNEGTGGQTLASQLDELFAGGLYINFHTEDFPGGEIRGQIVGVPEPGSLALLGIGVFGMLGAAGLRRRRCA